MWLALSRDTAEKTEIGSPNLLETMANCSNPRWTSDAIGSLQEFLLRSASHCHTASHSQVATGRMGTKCRNCRIWREHFAVTPGWRSCEFHCIKLSDCWLSRLNTLTFLVLKIWRSSKHLLYTTATCVTAIQGRFCSMVQIGKQPTQIHRGTTSSTSIRWGCLRRSSYRAGCQSLSPKKIQLFQASRGDVRNSFFNINVQ